jgi:GTPase SAR1 family protein
MVVGEGRAGKTALCNSIMGKVFDEKIESTIGINELTCDIKTAFVGQG